MSPAEQRKAAPLVTGVLDYFTDALRECTSVEVLDIDPPADSIVSWLPLRGASQADASISVCALRLLQEEITGVAPAAHKHMSLLALFDLYKDAFLAVASVSKAGNDQHNPGEPLHWARSKSMDQADCIGRHLLDRGTLDTDGHRHSAKVAWRALANQQVNIEQRDGLAPSRGSK